MLSIVSQIMSEDDAGIDIEEESYVGLDCECPALPEKGKSPEPGPYDYWYVKKAKRKLVSTHL